MNNFVYSVCEVFSFLYPDRILSYAKKVQKCVKGAKIKRKLHQHGKVVMISPPFELKGGKYISVGEAFSVASGMILECWDQHGSKKYQPEIHIGNSAKFGRNNYIGCIDRITIGDNILTGSNVHITDHNHGLISSKDIGIPPIKRELFSKGAVVIGDNVWLGDNVMILPKVKIGNNVIVGANSVVTQDLPDNCVAAGAPARIVKEL